MESPLLGIGDITLDPSTSILESPAGQFRLTHTEFGLLSALMKNEGKVMPKAELLRSVWGYQSFEDTRTLEVHICGLRKKLGESGKNPRHILTVRFRGYQFCN